MVVIRSSHRDAVFNRAVLHLRSNSLKSICKKVQFLVNLDVISLQLYKKWKLSRSIFQSIWPYVWETISHQSFSQNNYFCKAPPESFFWKSGNFSGKLAEKFTLPINNCTKYELFCGGRNFLKCLQKLSGTIIGKNHYEQVFLVALWNLMNLKNDICV